MAEQDQNQQPQMAGTIPGTPRERREGVLGHTVQTYQSFQLYKILGQLSEANAKQQDFFQGESEYTKTLMIDQQHILGDIRDILADTLAFHVGGLKRQKYDALKAKDRANDLGQAQEEYTETKSKSGSDFTPGKIMGLLGLGASTLGSLYGALSPETISNFANSIKNLPVKLQETFPKLAEYGKQMKDNFLKGVDKMIAKMQLKFELGKQNFKMTSFGEGITKMWNEIKAKMTGSVEYIKNQFNKFLIEPMQKFLGIDPEKAAAAADATKAAGESKPGALMQTIDKISNWFKNNSFMRGAGAILGWLAKKLTPIAVFLSAWDGVDEAIERAEDKAKKGEDSTAMKTLNKVEGFIAGFTGSFVGGFANFVRNVIFWPFKQMLGDDAFNEDGSIKSDTWMRRFMKGIDEYDFAKELTQAINTVFDMIHAVIYWATNKIKTLADKLGIRTMSDQEENALVKQMAQFGDLKYSAKEDIDLKRIQERTKIGDLSKLTDEEINKIANDVTGMTGFTDLSESQIRMMLKKRRAGILYGGEDLGMTKVNTKLEEMKKMDKAQKDIDALDKKKSSVNVIDNSTKSGDTNVNTTNIKGTPAPPGLYSIYQDPAAAF